MNNKIKDILEWIYCIIIAIVLALLFRYYIGTPTIVQQVSMYPTLVEDQRLWLNRWGRTTKTLPERGDIITFEAPSKKTYTSSEIDKTNPIAKYEKEPTTIWGKFKYYVLEIGKDSYIKRVIALPGEHVELKNGKVYINGEELDEPYLQDDVLTGKLKNSDTPYLDIVVPEGCLFLMGDNRESSTDSRCFGCVPYEKIESRVLLRFWPLNLFGTVE